MAEILRIDTEKARLDPESVFAHPDALVQELALTRGQKLAALDRWALQIERRLLATSEGMPGNGTSDVDLALLNAIAAAREALQQPASSTPGADG